VLKFGQRVAAVLVASVLFGVSTATAGANDERGGRAKLLIIGDSVFDAFDHLASELVKALTCVLKWKSRAFSKKPH